MSGNTTFFSPLVFPRSSLKNKSFFKPDLKLSSFSMVLSDVIRKIKLETDFSGDENQPHTPYTNKQDRAVM